MRRYLLAIFIFQMLTIVACNDDDSCYCEVDIIGKWEAKEFLSVESRSYSKLDGQNPTINFKSDGTYDVYLDVNHCFGDFELSKDDVIQMSGAGCSEACCDSEFSEKFVEMLPQVTSFEIDGDVLRLYVSDWGWIKLEWISD